MDYGTVERVAACALKPLLRRWARLPTQALRARLAAARPPAAGRRWPHASALAFLQLVRERRLVANVVAADPRDGALEVLLIDTSGARDRILGDELVRAGHADPRPTSALGVSHSDCDAADVRALLADVLRLPEPAPPSSLLARLSALHDRSRPPPPPPPPPHHHLTSRVLRRKLELARKHTGEPAQ